jgi:hypothetical protein
MVHCSVFGKEIYYIVKVSKNSNLRITNETQCFVNKLLNPKTLLSNENKYHGRNMY